MRRSTICWARCSASGCGSQHLVWVDLTSIVYFAIRRRYELNVRRREHARRSRAHDGEDHRRHISGASALGRRLRRSLDSAVEMTVRHAEQLIDHYAHRLRRSPGRAPLGEQAHRGWDLPSSCPSRRASSRTWPSQPHSLYRPLAARGRDGLPDPPRAVPRRLAAPRARPSPICAASSPIRCSAHALWRSATSYAHAFCRSCPRAWPISSARLTRRW